MKLIKDLGVIFATENSKKKYRYGMYECPVCFTEFRARGSSVKSKNTTKCMSCSRRISKTKHNDSKSRLYNIYYGMKKRCTNKNHEAYKYYGAEGVSICDEWNNSYLNFKEWSLENGYSDELSIDRIDHTGNYEPNNCRWTTEDIQHRNTRRIMETNTSGYRGINKTKSGKFLASIHVNKSIRIGLYETIGEAVIARDNYIEENSLEHTKNIN